MSIYNNLSSMVPSMNMTQYAQQAVTFAKGPALSYGKVGCYAAAALVVGHKVAQMAAAGTLAVAAHVAKNYTHCDISKISWMEQQRDGFIAASRQNLVRDVAIATGLVAAGYCMDYSQVNIREKPPSIPNIQPKDSNTINRSCSDNDICERMYSKPKWECAPVPSASDMLTDQTTGNNTLQIIRSPLDGLRGTCILVEKK